MITGYLLLPSQLSFDLQGMPSLNKDNIPVLAASLAVLIVKPDAGSPVMKGWIPRRILPACLLLLIFVALLFTAMTNGDVLIYGPTVLPMLGMKEAFTSQLGMGMVLLPFLLGRKLLAHEDSHHKILVYLVISGMFYSFLALYEVRMSPQLNNMIYGFFPHAFEQHVRANGYRPIVFLNHGLWLSIYFSLTAIAAFSLFRSSDKSQKNLYLAAGVWLLISLVLSKSLGALLIAIMVLSLLFFTGARLRLTLAALIAVTALTYPALRGADLIPLDRALSFAESISPERSSSLKFRIEQEDLFLEKINERPLFGWGGFGRNFAFDTEGRPTTVPDGYWIITIGLGGWMRYIGEFGLLCLPIIFAAVRRRKYKLSGETIAVSLILTANIIDLIPNATVTPITWMIAGALWGRLELGVLAQPTEAVVNNETVDSDRKPAWQRTRAVRPRYTRQNSGSRQRNKDSHTVEQ